MEANSQTKKKKQVLGRGLDSLLGTNGDVNPIHRTKLERSVTKETKVPLIETERVWQVAIDKLVANTNQPRKIFEREALQSLSDSIKKKGILQPVVARRLSQDTFEIIAGERRWRAAQFAGLHEIPVILKSVDNQNTLELALIENIQREDLNVIEEAEAYQFLMNEYKLTQQDLADRIGKDRASIANTVRLLNLSPPVRKMVNESQLSRGQAKLLVVISDEKLQLEIAQKIVKERMSVRAAEKFIANINKKASKSAGVNTSETSQPFVKGLSGELQKILGTKVNIDYKKGQGQLSIYYYSDDELNQLIDRLRSIWQN